MSIQWTDVDISAVRQRYNRLARRYDLIDLAFFVRTDIRKQAVDRLSLKAGDRVLEIGCGTGKNLALLRAGVGPRGHVYGVDLSDGMLQVAEDTRRRNGRTNVTLVRSDIADYAPPEPVQGVLFSLSYNTMPHHRQVLRQTWEHLASGGNLVVMDAKLPAGRFGGMILPFILWAMRASVLSNPFVRPWEELRTLTDDLEMEQHLFSYYICRARKPPVAVGGARPQAEPVDHRLVAVK
jgi:demethylmenaquinone methyltransferase/2-methoxy-6-polyprenyl-1,4-benzoquinol methylase